MIKILPALLAIACSARPVAHELPAPAPVPPVAVRATGPSLYELPLTLTSAAGVREQLDLDRGHPTLISMFYGSCAAACPLLIDTLDRTLRQLPEHSRDQARVLLVSFDPARDTPARLRELARVHGLDRRWTLAAANADDALTLAAVLGIRYRATPDGQFFHTSVIVALDGDGRTTARMDGIGDPSGLVAALTN
jgi:protein SCO1/2